MDKISIIIPVFNAVEYIAECLDSVCGQTYTNIEIICIDDGSTDGTEKILDDYARKDSRVIVIHQENNGKSHARNQGLALCRGDYIGFVDSDDWIEKEMYQNLWETAKRCDSDLTACSYMKEYADKSHIMRNNFTVSKDVFGRNELLIYVYRRDVYRGVTGYIVCKLFKRSLLFSGENLRHLFDERLCIGEDVLFFAQIACEVQRAAYLENAYYHYRQRENSTMHTQNLEKWTEFLSSYKRVISYFEEVEIADDIINWVRRFLAYWASKVLELAVGQKNIVVISECKNIMQKYGDIYESLNAEYPDRIYHFRKLIHDTGEVS